MAKVSVIMNTINEDQKYLKLAIESYLKQDHHEIELIISTLENDPNIEFMSKYPVKIVTMKKQVEHSPKGSFLQLNNALPHITGEWFTFCSGNDVTYHNKISLEVDCCLKNKKEVCYSAFNKIDEAGEYIGHVNFHEYDYNKHLKGNFVADCSLISKRLVDKYLPFNIELNNYAYWDLWLRIFKGEGNVFCYNSIPTWGYRQDRNSMHVKRFADPVKMREAEIDKENMLKRHR
jgi:teichuronic acid biosynthesis glycosyltransferase TuaG